MSYRFGPNLDAHFWVSSHGGLQEIERFQSVHNQSVVMTFGDGTRFDMEIGEFSSYKKFKLEFLRQMSILITDDTLASAWPGVVNDVINYAPLIPLDTKRNLFLEIMETFVAEGKVRPGSDYEDEEKATALNIPRWREAEDKSGILFLLSKLEEFCRQKGYDISRKDLTFQIKATPGARQTEKRENYNTKLWYWPCKVP